MKDSQSTNKVRGGEVHRGTPRSAKPYGQIPEYGGVLDLFQEIILILDEDLRIVHSNKAAADALGLKQQHPHLTSLTRLIDNATKEEFRRRLSLPTGDPFEVRFLKADQSVIEVKVELKRLSSGDQNHVLMIARDITEEKKKDLDLLRFSNVIHHTINPIEFRAARGMMVDVNPAFEKVTGYPKDELIGKNPRVLSSGKHGAEFWRAVWNEILAGNVWTGQIENRRKDGSPLHTELVISPIVDGTGTVVGFLGAHRDITEQKLLKQQLVQSQKMESIGTLAAGIAHEVGNPLTSISSLVQVIQRTTDDELAKEKLELIRSQISRISRTIRALVDFSRPSTYVEQLTDVSRVVQDALNIIKYGKKVNNIDFRVEASPQIPLLKAVPDQLTQVFINILMNAVDSLEGKPGTIGITTMAGNGGLSVAVRDTGRGIRPEDREKIFDPFFTTKEVGQGTGLGLWVSYSIVKNFGGDIRVESHAGKGSTFTVLFPLKGKTYE